MKAIFEALLGILSGGLIIAATYFVAGWMLYGWRHK